MKIYSLQEVIRDINSGSVTAQEQYLKMARIYVSIIQDVDRLDILKQILRGDYIPFMTNKQRHNVHPEIYDKFYNGEDLNINQLREKGIWTCNAGQLVRWSFIYKCSLVDTIKYIKECNIITDIWNKKQIDDLKLGYNFILELMDNLIKSSDDGINITNADKKRALQMTRKI